MRADFNKLVESFGNPEPPRLIVQGEYDVDPQVFRKLCNAPGAEADPNLLYQYVHDVCWLDDESIQPELLEVVLPKCLEMWRKDIVRMDLEHGGTVEMFWTAMARHQGFKKLLSIKQFEAVGSFISDGILDSIDLERSLSFEGMVGRTPYHWFHALGSFATVFSTLAELWEEWWSSKSSGHARGVLQYASCLMYPEYQNPIFAPWTHDRGGGPPGLWETEGHIYDRPWREENIAFLRSTLTPEYIRGSMQSAADMLDGIQLLLASTMIEEFPESELRVAVQIEELLDNLALTAMERRIGFTQ